MNTTNLDNSQHNLDFEGEPPQKNLLYWIEQIKEDPLISTIITSDAFARLKKISFLGAIDYLHYESTLTKGPRSRAEHSICVAALAAFVAHHRNYNKELTQHIVVAGLLHDIGHPPLSHSVEPYLKQFLGIGHHEMGETLLRGEHKISKKLHKDLKNQVDIDVIEKFISGDMPRDFGGDLFSSPINIDTIDGIIRSLRYYKKFTTIPTHIDIAYSSFIEKEESKFKKLDQFWNMKNLVYKIIINREDGILADKYSQIYFTERNELDESSIFENELDWRKKHSNLFEDIKKIRFKNKKIKELEVEYYDREYSINNFFKNNHRFESKKTKKKLTHIK